MSYDERTMKRSCSHHDWRGFGKCPYCKARKESKERNRKEDSMNEQPKCKKPPTSEFVKESRKLCYGYEDGWDSKSVPHPLAVCAHKLGEACDRVDVAEAENKTLIAK